MARKRRTSRLKWGAALAVVIVVGGVLLWPKPTNHDHARNAVPEPGSPSPIPGAPIGRPVEAQPAFPQPKHSDAKRAEERTAASPPAAPLLTPASNPASPEAVRRAEAQVQKGKAAEAANRLIEAREHYRLALEQGLPQDARQEVLRRLYDIAAKTLFSRERIAEDPLTHTHVVAAGETLEAIAQRYKVTPSLLAKINGLHNINQIRAGQRLKVINGPFHLVVDKSAYTLWVYLQDVPVAEYRVGLGTNGGTPTGRWRVKAGQKLLNPTFFDPDGGPTIAADDPENPLGERWIGIEGVEGEAVGREGFGIHGTIDPASIGKSQSRGCVRMRNEDVAEVFDLVVPLYSQVTIQP